MKIHLKFPCGYELIFQTFTLWNDFEGELPICPLHGKNCKKSQR